MISDELRRAYLTTRFIVHTKTQELIIYIGKTHPLIDALVEKLPQKSWSYITAYNPGSLLLTKTENEARQTKLKKSVDKLGLQYLEGEGIGEDPSWNPEKS
ncbi:MAG: DUF3293 domain-containing protein [Candidatus Levyibacteriota bacterium]